MLFRSTVQHVSIAADGATAVTVDVGAGTTTILTPKTSTSVAPGTARTAVAIAAVTVEPGAVLPMTISSGAGGQLTVSVPVLDGTQPEYTALVPTAD